jgi:molybdenum cofactor cytidylyltransferase
MDGVQMETEREKDFSNQRLVQKQKELRSKKIALILLAAGNSVRFGGNKLLSLYHGKRMYRHIVDQVEKLAPETFAEKIVVSQYREILKDLAAKGYTAVQNPAPEQGISHSIHLGLDAVRSLRKDENELGVVSDRREIAMDAVCFTVCDQPDLKAETLAGFIAGWEKSGKTIGCLSHDGIAGNPVIFDLRYADELRALTGDVGGKRVLKAHPEEVYYHEITDGAELVDIDTPLKLCYNER